jgi:hypothetical protein
MASINLAINPKPVANLQTRGSTSNGGEEGTILEGNKTKRSLYIYSLHEARGRNKLLVGRICPSIIVSHF